MTNYEHYKEQIDKITRLGLGFGIDKETEKIDVCFNQKCEDCKFYAQGSCVNNKTKWADAEYIEPEVDWSKVVVDTPILVRNSTDNDWLKRYFAKYENGRIYAFIERGTSWSSEGRYLSWNYARLEEVE